MRYPPSGAVVQTLLPVEANEVDGKNISKNIECHYDLFKCKLLVGYATHTIIT